MEDAPTLADLFQQRCVRTPNGLAYVQYRDGDWRQYTWQQTYDAVARWQAAMRRDGLQAGDRVAIMCSNSWEWVTCDQAALALGLITVPVYTNDRADNIAWILRDSGAAMLMIEGRAQWQMLSELHAELASLKRVLTLETVDTPTENVAVVTDWLRDGDTEFVREPGEPDSLATIVYTSGTTGRPKGVMLSHRNILFNIDAALQVFDVFEHDLMLSFLPLSHALERTVGYYLPMSAGTAIAYNRSIPQLAEDLAAIQPTLMISVPRIFERVYTKIHDKLATESALKRRLFEAAIDTGWRHFLYSQGRAGWQPSLLLRPLLDLLVGRKVRAKLGGRMRFTVCGGAALPPGVAKLFIGLGIPVAQGYGLTETSPVIAANPLGDNEPASVGLALPGVEVRLGQDDELITRSPSVMLGYWNNPEATAQIIDSDGWLHTGDKVAVAGSGHISITGRIKDIIVLSTGEKVPPGDMENAIALDELVDQVLVIGEGRPYLSAIVVPNPEAFARVAAELHLDPANEATCCDENVRSIFMQHVQRQIASFPGYAQVRQLAVVNEAWTPDNGLATPTLKLRRAEILERYHAITEKLYAGH
ncbi:MAG: long-chain fatty acid--CoA ligase [Gammaproteobacteria bacterium]|nr:long-chain fatty acid--CoA ligase [Gammaproteobacteria bacterium]MCP5299545.1 long-chain fatty acid--CoA ligase [Chromatiaceae bacterium]